jgi:hypothetical protein
MRKAGILFAIAFAALPVLAGAQTSKKAESKKTIQSEAKITEAAAREIAIRQVPNGTVKSSELEREKGKLVYSFDITAPAKTGVDEVLVDAISGKVISIEHESPMMEKAEARKEAKEAKSAAKAAAKKK